jgi:hypothetical protein
MKNAVRAIVVGGMTSATVLIGAGAAMAASNGPTYPPVVQTPTTQSVPAATPLVAVLGETVAKPAPVVAVAPSASLPFTGMDTMALVGVGAVLVVGGSALTIAARKRRSDSL